MAEPFTSPGTQRSVICSTVGPAPFSCYTCKRRKLKCDRVVTGCLQCQKQAWSCEYPTHAEKPGPKPGSSQKRKRKKPSLSPDHVHDRFRGNYTTSVFRVLSSQDIHVRSRDGADDKEDSAGRLNTHQSAPLFSAIMYPSHDAQTRPPSPSSPDDAFPEEAQKLPVVSVDSICEALQITRVSYDRLIDTYFTNMTAFSLFKPSSIETKLSQMQHLSEAVALVAAMFSFAVRHAHDREVNGAKPMECPGPAYFAQLASSQLRESLDRYEDIIPPLWVLHSSILVTFYHLTRSVRSKSWRTLGTCIRLAYDLNLHIVDANYNPDQKDNAAKRDIRRWSALEERRRAWWTIWEMDVFASTIRQLPTAIDGSLNLTLLPVPDDCWFNNVFQNSCFLIEDCSLRWKKLAESGNKSSKAWFIVMNSIMRNTQRIVYPSGSAMWVVSGRHETNQDELDIMSNALYCTITSIPAELLYRGETLDFRPETSHGQGPGAEAEALAFPSRHNHADKYALHLITQLCRFMIFHHKICAHAPWLSKGSSSDPTAQLNSEWSNYMNASDEIVTVVRNSSRDHYKYVSPFLTNTLWFAAAAQCACNVFGPPTYSKRLTSSRLDLLKLTIDQYISFWDGMDNLKNKLARIEARLKALMESPNGIEGVQESPQKLLTRTSGIQRSGASTFPAPGGTTSAPAQTPMLPSLDSDGILDPNPSFVPEIYDFTQMPDHDLFLTDPMSLSPFGLEELLMAGMAQHY